MLKRTWAIQSLLVELKSRLGVIISCSTFTLTIVHDAAVAVAGTVSLPTGSSGDRATQTRCISWKTQEEQYTHHGDPWIWYVIHQGADEGDRQLTMCRRTHRRNDSNARQN